MYPPYFELRGAYAPYGGGLVPYGSLNLTETSPGQSFIEPLSLDEMKAYLLLPELATPDIQQEDTITALIIAAREQAEIAQGRDLVRKQWDLSLDYWTSYRIELRAPLVTVDLVKYRDSAGAYTTCVADTDYLVDAAKQPGVIAPPYNTSWPSYTPWPSSSLLIRFTSGFASNAAWWGDSGARVKLGMKLLISGWFNGRIPWAIGAGAASEYPFAVTSCLSHGAIERVR